MPTSEQVRTLSTPKVYIEGVVWPIVPNSFKSNIPGETKVRFMSSGGNGGQIVSGLNAEELKGKVKFSVATTLQMINRVREVKDATNAGNGVTIRAVDGPYQGAWQTMFLVNDTEVSFEAEGVIELEFEGEYVP